MGDEIQALDTTFSPETDKQQTNAETKRRRLEEDMRKEAAERKKKRDALLQKEEEYEQVTLFVCTLFQGLLLALSLILFRKFVID